MTGKNLISYLLTGLISGVLCWSGAYFLPETSLALKVFPGIIFGLALFLCGVWARAIPKSRRVWAGLLLLVFTIAGWRLPVELVAHLGDSFRYVFAGAIGSFVVALGLLAAWEAPRNRVVFVILVTLSGTLGGLIFQLIPVGTFDINDKLKTLFLLVEWQTIVMLGVGFARTATVFATR